MLPIREATRSPMDDAMRNMRLTTANEAAAKTARDAEVAKRQKWHKDKGGRIFGF